jgi:TonB family protein
MRRALDHLRRLTAAVTALLALATAASCHRSEPAQQQQQQQSSTTTKQPTPDEEAWPCYAPELAKDPKLEGDMQVSFEVGVDGQVHSAKVVATSLQNTNVELCVVSLVDKWKIANPTGKELHGAKYTFRFHPPKK